MNNDAKRIQELNDEDLKNVTGGQDAHFSQIAEADPRCEASSTTDCPPDTTFQSPNLCCK